MASKPMKPVKAWAILDTGFGCVASDCIGYDRSMLFMIYKCKADASRDKIRRSDERVARVRILDDAAAGRAIAILRTTLRLEGYDHKVIKGAIRDLGGRP